MKKCSSFCTNILSFIIGFLVGCTAYKIINELNFDDYDEDYDFYEGYDEDNEL